MVEINNLTNCRVNKEFLKKTAQNLWAKGDLSIALVGEKKIRELNKKYRRKDKVTDVLSFKYDDNSGEVVICPQETKDIVRTLTHGILHILGYTHQQMERKNG